MFSIRKISLAVAMAAAPFLATAEDYQFEVSAGYLNTEVESFEVDTVRLDGTFYWNQVSTAGHPLAEAAFMERQGGLTASYVALDSDFIDTYVLGLKADHYFGNGVYIAGRVASPEEGDEAWGASIGYSPLAGLLFVVDADNIDDDAEYTGRVKYVGELQGETAFGIEAEFDEDVVSLSGDYFFNRSFSLGAQVIGDDDTTALVVDTKYFFAPRFWAGASVGTNVSGDVDSTAWNIEAGLRF